MNNHSNKALTPNQELAIMCGELATDPLGWVIAAFPWDTDPDLQLVELQEPWRSRYNSRYGPDSWFCELCDEWRDHMLANPFDGSTPVRPFRKAVGSGHGIGKSAGTAMIILFIQSTRPFSKGVVTSNTSDQLRTKTWGELAKWYNKCITRHWFDLNSGKGNMSLAHVQHKETWRVDAITCREENSESFAGLHCANASPWYLFDEASAVPDKIWEVAEGGTTDGEPFWFVFGNPTRNSGRFRECWRKFRKMWSTTTVDSRSVQVTNKQQIQQWLDTYGEDSDFFRVRVRGVFPSASSMQKIPTSVLEAAMERNIQAMPGSPRIMSLDVARGGDDDCVIDFREGQNGKVRKKLVLPGAEYRDSMKLVTMVMQQAAEFKPDAIIVDETGVGGPVGDRLRQLNYPAYGINFASASPNPRFANMRAYMADQYLQWLNDGGCIEHDTDLLTEAGAVEYNTDGKDREILIPKKEIKKAIGISTDKFDAQILLHAIKIMPKSVDNLRNERNNQAGYDPFNSNSYSF